MQLTLENCKKSLEPDAVQEARKTYSDQGLAGNSLDRDLDSKVLAIHHFIFRKIGAFIGHHQKLCIGFAVTAALTLSLCNVFMRFDDDFRTGYSQLDSDSQKEHAIFLDFTGLKKQPYVVMLVGESVDGGSMLRREQFMNMRREIIRGLDIELNISRKHNGEGLLPQRLRDQIIFSDETQFALIETALNHPGPYVELSYPVAKLHGQKVMMARAIYDYKNKEASMLAYFFGFKGENPYLDYIKEAEVLWSEQLKVNDNNVTRMRLFGDAVVNSEISAGAFGACPYFLVGSASMVLFVFITVFHYSKDIKHAIYLTFWTIFCPLLAGTCSMAIVSALGIPINCVMLITPFLVLGVGVDDAFLMMHYWFESQEVDVIARLYALLLRTGPSITLTSFTNVSAFLIGSFLSAPDLRLFCFSSALAFALDWFLQLFLFTPILISFKKERDVQLPDMEKKKIKPFAVIYCEWLRLTSVRCVLVFLVLIYWAVSIYGGISMKEEFSPEKTFDSQSFLAKSLVQNEEMFRDHEMIRVFIHQLPNKVTVLKERLKKFREIYYLCEDFPTWIEEYDAEGLGDNKQDTAGYFENIAVYLTQHPGAIKDVRFNFSANPVRLHQIAFDLCVRGAGSWRDRALMLQDLRLRMPEGFSVYMSESAVFALIISSRTAILKSVVVTIICMAVICLLFVPTIRAATGAIISVASITVGVIGGLYLWGADLDTMVLVNVVMAVGLTVDFSAHISYHCFSESIDIKKPDRFAEAIQAIAVPSTYAALTTVICVFPLYFYSVYIYVTFAKTIFLIATLGLIHTIFIVPLIISVI